MDPRTFDRMIRRLSSTRSRRSLVGGSLGSAVLMALGWGQEAGAKKRTVKAEDKLGIGARCDPSNKEHGKKHGCRKCRTDYSVKTTRKGKTIRKCACKPVGEPSSRDKQWQCCSGLSDGSRCTSPPGAASTQGPCRSFAAACTADTDCCAGFFCGDGSCRTAGSCRVQGQTCNEDDGPTANDCCTGECLDGTCLPAGTCIGRGDICTAPGAPDCCNGVCNAGGSDVNGTANECASCRTGGATCASADDPTCCAGRVCQVVAAPELRRCCSLTGEPCIDLGNYCCPGLECGDNDRCRPPL